MSTVETDPSLYLKNGKEVISGILYSYVDDYLLGGDKDLQEHTKIILDQFDSRKIY